MPPLFHVGLGNLGYYHTPGAWAASNTRLECSGPEGAGEDVPANEPPLDLECLVPWGCHHNLQIQADRPPSPQLKPT